MSIARYHYGSRSRRGTEVAALIESAKLRGLDPHKYPVETSGPPLRAMMSSRHAAPSARSHVLINELKSPGH